MRPSVIRAVRPTDAPRLFSFVARSHPIELTAQTWPEVPPEAKGLSLLRLLLLPLVYPAFPRGTWVNVEHGRVVGVAVARARAGGLVWDVERLFVLLGRGEAASDLLEHLSARAARGFARRIFFDGRIESRVAEVARRAGFSRYTSSALYVLTPPFVALQQDRLEARPRHTADEQPLFQMYNAAVPLAVRSAEAMTIDEWAALYRGANRWPAAIFGAQDQFVWEIDGCVAGWMELDYGRRSQHLSLLVRPRHEGLADNLLHFALGQANPRFPLYATLREYQPTFISALERIGFRLVSESDAFVRHLAVRVPEARLVPAKIVGGC
jgi:hypothetical protein